MSDCQRIGDETSPQSPHSSPFEFSVFRVTAVVGTGNT